MKIRKDFVTNSSSSSFILFFPSEDCIEQVLREQFPHEITPSWSCGDGYLNQLLEDIDEAERLTPESVRDRIESGHYYIRWDMEDELAKNGMSRQEIKDYLASDEGKKALGERFDAIFESVMKKIGDSKVIVEVDHGDGGMGEDGVLEKEILPSLGCMATIFSHH